MFKLPLKQNRRQILHIDADAFFVSVEQVLNPKLRGKPVAVGGPSGTHGIISAASYEARHFGLKSGMPVYKAKRLCPQLVLVPGSFDAYRDFSRRMFKIFNNYTPDVEMASIDEAYLDITGCAEMFDETDEMLAKSIMMEIYGRLGISVSCGMASSKTVAKVASSQNKPHKFTLVPYGSEASFLAGLGLRAMPGIGPRTCDLLERYGLKRIGDLAAMSSEEIVEKLGLNAIPLWKRARGVDNSEVISVSALPKSISKESTFYQAVNDEKICMEKLKILGSRVLEKLRSYKLRARTVFVRVRYKDIVEHKFEDYSFQKHLSSPTAVNSVLLEAGKKLFLENWDRGKAVRLVGIGVTNLQQNYNLSLFESDQEEEKLCLDIDAMRKLYGPGVISYGADVLD